MSFKKWVEIVAENDSPLPPPRIFCEILWKGEYGIFFLKPFSPKIFKMV